MLPDQGSVSAELEKRGIPIFYRSLHENNGLLKYARAFAGFVAFLREQGIGGIMYMDFGWWKPAEVLAAKICRVPQLALIVFYRPELARRGFLRLVDRIVANSESTAEDFREAGLSGKTSVIYNFINTEDYENANPATLEDEQDCSHVIGYVGVLHPVKGIEYLLQAMPGVLQQFPSVRLVLAGQEKTEGQREKLEQLVSELDLNKRNVRFLGYQENIPALMKRFDLLAVPSLQEPFGFVLIEAGAAGTPVVASRVGGIPEIVSDGENGILCDPAAPEQLSEAICRLLSDKALRETYGRSLKAQVREKFSKQAVMKHWNEQWKMTFGEARREQGQG